MNGKKNTAEEKNQEYRLIQSVVIYSKDNRI